jgi:hypothetical protein
MEQERERQDCLERTTEDMEREREWQDCLERTTEDTEQEREHRERQEKGRRKTRERQRLVEAICGGHGIKERTIKERTIKERTIKERTWIRTGRSWKSSLFLSCSLSLALCSL